MHFTIQREAFLKPLKAVAGVVERRNHQMIPILSNVLLDVRETQFFLTTTDQEVELIATGEVTDSNIATGKITVPFRKLMDICRTLPEGALLTFKTEQDKVCIRAGRSRFSLSSLPAEQFPSISESKQAISLVVANKALKQLVDNVSFAMADQDVRYYLNGMLLEIKEAGLYGVAADGHRLALSVIKGITCDTSLRLIVPRKGVLELQRILEENDEAVTLMLDTHHLCVTTKEVTLTTKLLEGKFPEYQRIIPEQGDKVVVGRRTLLKEALLRAATLFNDKSRGVRLRITNGCLNILATNTEQDEVEEDVEVEYQGDELEIGFNIRYLIDFLTVIQEEWVRFTFTNASSSARVEGVSESSQTYVIMPMKI